MANTTLRSLTAITGTTLDNADLFLAHDYSANTEYKVSLSDLRTAIGNVGSGALTISSSGTTDALIVTSTDSGSAGAPNIIFSRDSATPASSDIIGSIRFRGKNSSAANIEYGYIGSVITTATAGSETGLMSFNLMNNGTSTLKFAIRGDGGVGIGSSGQAFSVLNVAKNITGATSSYGINVTSTVNSDITGTASAFRTNLSTASSNVAYTIGNLRHYDISPITLGANCTITNQTGVYVGSLTAGAFNYSFLAEAATASAITTGKFVSGFLSNNPIATGGGASWNFYALGTAPNYFNGVMTIGTATPNAAAKVQIDSTTQGFLPPRMTTTQRNAISSPPAGLTIYNSTTNKLNFYNGTAWEAVTSA